MVLVVVTDGGLPPDVSLHVDLPFQGQQATCPNKPGLFLK